MRFEIYVTKPSDEDIQKADGTWVEPGTDDEGTSDGGNAKESTPIHWETVDDGYLSD